MDIDHPSEIRGVAGYRQPKTVTVTETSGRVRLTNPHAEMDLEVSRFLQGNPTQAQFEAFKDNMDWRWGHLFWEAGAGR
jgi:hypothetical protein